MATKCKCRSVFSASSPPPTTAEWMQNHSPVLLGEKEVTSRSSTSRETLRGWEWINSWKREMIRRKETQAHISYIRHTRYTWHKQERQSDTIREEEKKNPNKEEKDNADKEQLNEKKRRTHDPATGFLSRVASLTVCPNFRPVNFSLLLDLEMRRGKEEGGFSPFLWVRQGRHLLWICLFPL